MKPHTCECGEGLKWQDRGTGDGEIAKCHYCGIIWRAYKGRQLRDKWIVWKIEAPMKEGDKPW